MFPLSGELQLKTSGDQGIRPVISASGASCARLIFAQARQEQIPKAKRAPSV
jgi:hypothetical protein